MVEATPPVATKPSAAAPRAASANGKTCIVMDFSITVPLVIAPTTPFVTTAAYREPGSTESVQFRGTFSVP